MMRPSFTIPVLVIVLIGLGIVGWYTIADPSHEPSPREPRTVEENNAGVSATTSTEKDEIAVVAKNLTIPWDIAFLPDGSMLVTERPGQLVHIEEGTTIDVDGVRHTGEGGLLGIALHPNFPENRYVYLYQTTEAADGLTNRVVRYTYADNTLSQDTVIIDGIAGALYHDGGRIAFGPDGYLWITAGDATVEANAQDPQTRAGSIMRVNPDGSIPDGNPFGNAVYSYGHRNPQGLAWDDEGRLWSTEHGRSGALSGMDEINLIKKGANYGWPDIEGDETTKGMVTPKAHSGPDVTWAPASAVYLPARNAQARRDGSIYFGGLRGAAVYEAVLDGTQVTEVRRHLHNAYGRIRSIVKGPNGDLYLTTSNRDGRGEPVASDDRIIRVTPEALSR